MCVENPLLAFIDLVNKLRAGDVLTEDLKQPFSQVGASTSSPIAIGRRCASSSRRRKIAAACAFLTVVFLRALPDDRPRTAALYGARDLREEFEEHLHADGRVICGEQEVRAAVEGPGGDGPRARGAGEACPQAAGASFRFRGRRDAVAVGAVFFFLRRSIVAELG